MKIPISRLLLPKNLLTSFFITTLCCLPVLAMTSCDNQPEFSYDFESDEELDHLYWKCGTIYSLSEVHLTSGNKSLRADMYPASSGSGNIYPGISFIHYNKNWSKSHSLAFDIINPSEESLPLTLRIDDQKNPPYEDRYNVKLDIKSGLNTFKLAFRDFITPGTHRNLDMSDINSVIFFIQSPEANHTLYFDNFRLE